jgi:hypothetical protein
LIDQIKFAAVASDKIAETSGTQAPFNGGSHHPPVSRDVDAITFLHRHE